MDALSCAFRNACRRCWRLALEFLGTILMPGKCRETAGTFTGLESGTITALAIAGVVLGPGAVAGRPAGADPTDRRDCQASGALSVERTALEWNITGDMGRALPT